MSHQIEDFPYLAPAAFNALSTKSKIITLLAYANSIMEEDSTVDMECYNYGTAGHDKMEEQFRELLATVKAYVD